jgi:hypothetical protein
LDCIITIPTLCHSIRHNTLFGLILFLDIFQYLFLSKRPVILWHFGFILTHLMTLAPNFALAIPIYGHTYIKTKIKIERIPHGPTTQYDRQREQWRHQATPIYLKLQIKVFNLTEESLRPTTFRNVTGKTY